MSNLADRFWAKVDTTDDDSSCWEWTGYKMPRGYGVVGVNGSTQLAHRVSYSLVNGDIPDGMCIDAQDG